MYKWSHCFNYPHTCQRTENMYIHTSPMYMYCFTTFLWFHIIFETKSFCFIVSVSPITYWISYVSIFVFLTLIIRSSLHKKWLMCFPKCMQAWFSNARLARSHSHAYKYVFHHFQVCVCMTFASMFVPNPVRHQQSANVVYSDFLFSGGTSTRLRTPYDTSIYTHTHMQKSVRGVNMPKNGYLLCT